MHKLFPVITRIPEKERMLKGRDRLASLSSFARRGLAMSAEKYGIKLPKQLNKDENGAPLPANGIFWSLSHKPEYAAGVVAPYPIGIDIEKIRSYSDALKRKIADQNEWDLGDPEPSETLLFRYWTAKESVLKATGIGLKGLSSCRITDVPDQNHLIIQRMGRKWIIEHFYFDNHIASIIKNEYKIIWSVIK